MIEQLNNILSSGTDAQLIGFFFGVFSAFVCFAFMIVYLCVFAFELGQFIRKKFIKRSNKE